MLFKIVFYLANTLGATCFEAYQLILNIVNMLM